MKKLLLLLTIGLLLQSCYVEPLYYNTDCYWDDYYYEYVCYDDYWY